MFVTVRKVWQVVALVPLDAQVVLVQACLAVAISTAAYAGLHAYNRQSRRGRFQLQHRSIACSCRYQDGIAQLG